MPKHRRGMQTPCEPVTPLSPTRLLKEWGAAARMGACVTQNRSEEEA